MWVWCGCFVLALGAICLVRSGEVKDFIVPSFCNSTQSYDAVGMVCRNCGENQATEKETGVCSCLANYKLTEDFGNGSLICGACPVNQTTTSDGLSCISCSSITCAGSCEGNSIRIERYWNGSLLDKAVCIPCTNGTEPNHDRTRCVTCSQYLLKSQFTCDCPSSTHELLGRACLLKSDLADIPNDRSLLTTITYDNGIQVDSDYLNLNLRAAATVCKVHHNQTACQVLANSCVYLHYSYDKGANPCTLYRQMGNSENVPEFLPWLYYSEDSGLTLFSKPRIPISYNVNPSSNDNVLNFTFVAFSPEGHFKGITYASQNPLQLCPDSQFKLSQAFRFGTKFLQTCQLKLAELVQRPPWLYDVYLQYRDANSSKLFAVPIKVLNYKRNGQLMNQGSEASFWQVTRRLYLVDKVTGVQEGKLLVVQYLSKVSISLTLARGEAGKILTPLITLEYKAIEVFDADHNLYPITFEVDYNTDVSSTVEDIKIAIGVFSALAAVWSSIQTWSWWRRSGKLTLELSALVKLLATACGALANVFLAIMYFAALYWLIVFKQQEVAFLMAPNEQLALMVRNYIIAACVLKFVDVVHLIARQVTVDLFFIDWERPQPSAQDKKQESVSIWRTYFVANEWNEIQTIRKQSVALTLFITLLFLKVVGFENLAIANPSNHFVVKAEDLYSPPNPVFRFALGTSIYVAVTVVQVSLQVLVYERFVENKLQQFIDLCSLSNVSVWIMSERRFGYYIHGRSAHGFADTDMETMSENLKKEADDLCGHRGLVASSDQQVFEMTIPMKLVTFYERVLLPIQNVSKGFRPAANFDKRQSFQAYHTMNRFLASYLDHAIRDLDYDVKDKTFVEKVLDMELQESTERGFFYNDSNHSFSTLLFYGSEMTLFLFDLLLFAFVDFLAQDFVLSAIVTYLTAKLFAAVRYNLSRSNLGRKTLIDDRFLI